jgi:23S rRNA pseudouridine955/2504/2580 synthase/23S rRNA pseudouridine1911/1915/1917 synthase
MLPIEIIYEDDDVLVISKPAGMLTIPDRFDQEKPSVIKNLEKNAGKLFIVHRIDRETSGILLFAKHALAHQQLSMQFEGKTVEKRYLALVDGILMEDQGEINKPIAAHPTISGKMMVSSRGKESLTTYEVLERFRHFTLVEAQIHTGRTHQVRVHFKSIDHPLAVDSVYGMRSQLMLSELKQRKYKSGKFSDEEQPIMARTTLHAWKLTFRQPTTGETMRFEATPPKDFRALITQLRKWTAEKKV